MVAKFNVGSVQMFVCLLVGAIVPTFMSLSTAYRCQWKTRVNPYGISNCLFHEMGKQVKVYVLKC